MPRTCSFLLFLALSATTLPAQTATPASIQASGSATINSNPDQASMQIGVVTNGTTAQDAAQQNASLSNAVQDAIKAVIAGNGTIQTISYSVMPRYNNAQPAAIIGYAASNTVLVTSYDLSILGRLIDTANAAGANSVGGITFGLRNSDPLVQQALTKASKQALAHAAAIATGLGARTGAVISAQEGASYTPVGVASAGAGASTTPVQTGQVSVTANVVVTVQLVQ